MGKSTTAQLLRTRAIPVVDTDDLARQLVQPGEPALAEISAAFGEAIIVDGRLRRNELAQLVFSDLAARQKLEAILHPAIRNAWLCQVEAWRAEEHPLAVVVIPLLFETHAESHFDKIICVACSNAVQHQRLLGRGWNPDQIRQRLAAQWPLEQKIAPSDFLIWTEGNLSVHDRQLRLILARI